MAVSEVPFYLLIVLPVTAKLHPGRGRPAPGKCDHLNRACWIINTFYCPQATTPTSAPLASLSTFATALAAISPSFVQTAPFLTRRSLPAIGESSVLSVGAIRIIFK